MKYKELDEHYLHVEMKGGWYRRSESHTNDELKEMKAQIERHVDNVAYVNIVKTYTPVSYLEGCFDDDKINLIDIVRGCPQELKAEAERILADNPWNDDDDNYREIVIKREKIEADYPELFTIIEEFRIKGDPTFLV